MGQHVLSAGLQMVQNQEEWMIHQMVALSFRGLGQPEEFFQKERHEIQQWENPSLAPGEEQPRHQQADADQLESSFTMEDLGILVDSFTMTQQCALMAKKVHSLLGCIRQSVGRMLDEMINPSSYLLEPSDSLSSSSARYYN